MKRFLIPLSLIIFTAVAAWVDIQRLSVPMIRPSPLHPVYTIGAPEDAIDLTKGKLLSNWAPVCLDSIRGRWHFRA